METASNKTNVVAFRITDAMDKKLGLALKKVTPLGVTLSRGDLLRNILYSSLERILNGEDVGLFNVR